MRLITTILCLFFLSFSSWSQDFSIHINPGDYSNSSDVETIYINRTNIIFVNKSKELSKTPIDTFIVKTNNGKVALNDKSEHFIIPNKVGFTTIEIIIKPKEGQTIKRARTFKVIEYPSLQLKIKTNKLLSEGIIEFQIYSKNKNVTKDFGIGFYEFEILNFRKEKIFEAYTGGKLSLDLCNNEESFQIEKGETLKIYPIRLLYKKYNLNAFTKPLEVSIE